MILNKEAFRILLHSSLGIIMCLKTAYLIAFVSVWAKTMELKVNENKKNDGQVQDISYALVPGNCIDVVYTFRVMVTLRVVTV